MVISIFGAGYVGLVTAACLANMGNSVRCIDADRERIAVLANGTVPLHEPGLEEMVRANLAVGRLTFHHEASAAHGSLLAIIAVGTLTNGDKWTDGVVRRVVLDLAADREAPRIVVVRSTLLPGTALRLLAAARAINPTVQLAVNPEFTREGSAITDFMQPDRVVIGVPEPAIQDEAASVLRHLYEPFGAQIVVTDLTSAETIKVASNVFLAAKITLANELARLCAATGADVHVVVEGMGLDRRIGRAFLSPGPGFGGSCLPSQARALPGLAADLGVDTPMIAAIDGSNEAQAQWFVGQAETALGTLGGKQVGLLGAAFKAGTDDLRDSPALRLVRLLAARGAHLSLYDPMAAAKAQRVLLDEKIEVAVARNAMEACAEADVIFVATEWPEFHELDWADIGPTMRRRLIIDTRRVVDTGAAIAAGFEVVVTGVPLAGGQSEVLPVRRLVERG